MEKLDNLRKKLVEEGLDAVLISSVHNILYLTSYSNFSLFEREAYLLITKEKQFILTDGRYSEAVKSLGYELIERSAKKSHKQTIEKLAGILSIKVLGIEENNLTVVEYKGLMEIASLKNFYLDRSIKTPEEIKAIEEACRLADLGFKHLLKKIKLGVTEIELANEFESFLKKYGAEISLPTIVAFGPNSTIPHHQTGQQKLTSPATILLDLGARVDNFCSDMTRTIFFGGITDKQKKIYQTVLEAQQEAAAYVSSSKSARASQADKIARKYIIKRGFPSISHSLGHGVGHEIHEAPHLSVRSKEILRPGMVFTIEPGIYLPGFGGVRIEDTYSLKEDGLRQLTHSPKDLIVLK